MSRNVQHPPLTSTKAGSEKTADAEFLALQEYNPVSESFRSGSDMVDEVLLRCPLPPIKISSLNLAN